MKTAIIVRDADEAKLILKNKLAKKYPIITLSPAAQIAIESKGLTAISSTELCTNLSHAKNVIRMRNAMAEFEDLVTQTNLSENQIEVLKASLFNALGAISFFYELLKNVQSCYWFENGKIKQATSRQLIIKAIFRPIFTKNYPGYEPKISSLHKLILKNYNAKLLKNLGAKRKLLVIGGMGRKSLKDFAIQAQKMDSNITNLNARTPLRTIYFSWRKMKKSLSGKEKFPIYFFYPETVNSSHSQIIKIIAGAKNNFLELCLKTVQPYLIVMANTAAGYEANQGKDLTAINPELIVSDTVIDSLTTATRKFAVEQNRKVIIFNHASHSIQTTPISKTIGNLWASNGRIYSRYSTYNAPRSPTVAELVKQISPYKTEILPIRHDQLLPTKPNQKFKILFAGNYLAVNQHIPWILETPDEFIKGIADLANAVSKIPNAELIIRIKPGKKDFDLGTMQKFIPSHPNVIISNQGTLKDMLAEADLVVASISSTIDEALHSGRPILLLSGPRRYQHLAENETARSAVYAVKPNEPLQDLLHKIILAHQNKPLTEQELAPYIWPESTDNMLQLAQRVLEFKL